MTDEVLPDLKPCAYCGGRAKHYTVPAQFCMPGRGDLIWAACIECDSQSDYFYTNRASREDVAEDWHRTHAFVAMQLERQND